LLLTDEAEDWAEDEVAVELPAAAGAIAFLLRPPRSGAIALATAQSSERARVPRSRARAAVRRRR
ncbi:MAG: hypothetical protein M3065_14895, partial [Actinomycetota bacterium]|nr:hypothetical protein [Actinomycetota bacterium]